jgi:hypothetical protein
VASASGEAYGQNNLWRPKKAQHARDQADTALYAALDKLLTVVNAHLHPVEEPRPPRRLWMIRRRVVTEADNTLLPSPVPSPRSGDHDAGLTTRSAVNSGRP